MEKPTEGEKENYTFPTQIRVNIVALRKVENFNNEAHTSLYQKSWKLVFIINNKNIAKISNQYLIIGQYFFFDFYFLGS